MSKQVLGAHWAAPSVEAPAATVVRTPVASRSSTQPAESSGPTLERLLGYANEAVLELDAEWRALYANQTYLSGIGLKLEEVLGRTPLEFVPAFRRSPNRAVVEECYRTRKPTSSLGYSSILRRWMLARVFPCPDHGGVVMYASDASELMQQQQEMAREALYDDLTALPNARSLSQRIGVLADAGQQFCVVVLGLNNFDEVNDLAGVTCGDQLLVQVTTRMQAAVGEAHQLYRVRGAEFAFVHPGPENYAIACAQEVAAAAGVPARLDGREFALGASIGLANSATDGTDGETLLRRASLAMHEAKRVGQSSVLLYRDALGAVDPAWAGQREKMVEMGADWRVVRCNDVFLEDAGLSREQVIGRTPFEYSPLFARSIFYPAHERCMRTREPNTSVGYSMAIKRWVMARMLPMDHGGIMMLAYDATPQTVQAYRRASQSAFDRLTGLPGERALAADLSSCIDKEEPVALVKLKLTRLVAVNDAHGHAQGDVLVMQMASRLRTAVAAGAGLYRLHSDTFAALLRGSPSAAAEQVEALMAAASSPVDLNGREVMLSPAAGVAFLPRDGQTPDSAIHAAALALRSARREQAPVVHYDAELERAAQSRLLLESELRQAVRLRQFSLALQPKGHLTRSGLSGAEALIRWNHPTRGTVSPASFLPLAHECGLMPQIDQWVLEEALQHVKALANAGAPLSVSINLSIDSLGDPGLVDRIRAAVVAADVDPSMLEVEIPEGALMRDPATSIGVLQGLRELGVAASVDDFGTGYSSFAYLARFPLSALKIDRAFVAEMSNTPAGRTVVQGIIRLAHALNLRVVAEGAETAEQIHMLRSMSCDEVQGYGYARPMAFASFLEFATGAAASRAAEDVAAGNTVVAPPLQTAADEFAVPPSTMAA